MPLYMDVHETLPEGATAADVAGAHAEDLKIQAKYGVDYRSYWVDEANGKVFCLVWWAPQLLGGETESGPLR
ncbi:MAG: DUF4242 domain-containing protein [Nocardioides sp.]|nr:DUF4242 domain-containing protein [Nocardioides sp.]